MTAALLAVLLLPASAQTRAVLKYDVNFEYDFNNREYYAGDEAYSPSYTTHAARLTPSVGLGVRQSKAVAHNVMMGIDVLKDMGASPGAAYDDKVQNLGMLKELTLWYNIEARLPRSVIKGWAGMFPRRFSVFGGQDTPLGGIPGRNIPSVFLADWNRLYDNNLEGILLTATRRKAYYELGLDWLGLFGHQRREQFKVHSYGKGMVLGWLAAGWAAEVHHYANAIEYGHVMDNILLSPFVEFDLNKAFSTKLQEFSLSAGLLGSIHRDRKMESEMRFSAGPRAVLTARKWNVGISNEFYLGDDLMPYFDSPAPEGGAYGRDLYAGNTFYRVHGVSGGSTTIGFYERLEAFWQPRIADFLDLRISAVFHHTELGFQGWQQKFGLVFNLGKALRRESPVPGKDRRGQISEPRLFERFFL